MVSEIQRNVENLGILASSGSEITLGQTLQPVLDLQNVAQIPVPRRHYKAPLKILKDGIYIIHVYIHVCKYIYMNVYMNMYFIYI